MDQRLLWQKVNNLIEAQKKLDTFLLQQKMIVGDLIMRVQYLETLTPYTQEGFNAYKKDFTTKLEEYRKSVAGSTVQSANLGTDGNNGQDSGQGLPGKTSH